MAVVSGREGKGVERRQIKLVYRVDKQVDIVPLGKQGQEELGVKQAKSLL